MSCHSPKPSKVIGVGVSVIVKNWAKNHVEGPPSLNPVRDQLVDELAPPLGQCRRDGHSIAHQVGQASQGAVQRVCWEGREIIEGYK